MQNDNTPAGEDKKDYLARVEAGVQVSDENIQSLEQAYLRPSDYLQCITAHGQGRWGKCRDV